jgi:hypothetical protein
MPKLKARGIDEYLFSIQTATDLHTLSRHQATNRRTTDDSDDEAAEDESVPLVASSLGGWTLTSPHWSLSSDVLLSVTYAAPWQVLQQFTRCTYGTACAGCCCGCGCVATTEYMTQQFTCRDIVKVETVSEHNIRGMGSCQGMRVYLRGLGLDTLTPIPEAFQETWHEHVERASQNAQTNDVQLVKREQELFDADDVSTGNHIVLTFCLPTQETDPPLLWKIHLPVSQPVAIETLTVLDGELFTHKEEVTHIYINGYQSWSFAGSIPKSTPQPTSALPDMYSRAFNYGASMPPASEIRNATVVTKPFQKFYQSDFFTCITSDCPVSQTRQQLRIQFPYAAVAHETTPYRQLDETGGSCLVLGWLSNRKHFGLVAADEHLRRLQMHVSGHGQIVSESLTTDWAYAQLISPHSYDEEPMVHYLEHVAACNEARPCQNGSLLTGWCSWYFAYERISQQLLRDNFSKMAILRTTVPTNVAVVDDGYMTAWGDWDSVKTNEFPLGMCAVSQDISSFGMRPGIWMAPFAADKHSQLTKDHPDWIIRNAAGVPANSSNCGKFFYGLDATNPNVRKYVHHCVQRAVEEWGFNVLKIDFLYAACLEGNGKYDFSMSRAETMHLALKTIRDAAGPDVYLIGCGCPLATGIGFVDAMRVSADTGPTWYPAMPLPWWDSGTLPSLRAMIRNSVSRAPLGHRWWHNDPDCLMFGEHTRLTDDEVASAASIVAMTCGMLLLSDDLPKVPAQRIRILSKIFPLTGVSAVVLDLHSTNSGLPSLLRLWCTDKYARFDTFREQMASESFTQNTSSQRDHNAAATAFARRASYRPDQAAALAERQRSCVDVTKGLGTWTVVCISNWLDKADVVHIPPPALAPPPRHGWETGNSEDVDMRSTGKDGYHVFAFWSSKYSWLPKAREDSVAGPDNTISKMLAPHATEIFHIKPVTPDWPQYIGSDLHFSCGQELLSFVPSRHALRMCLATDYKRSGCVFVFIPRINTDTNVKVTVAGVPGRWTTIANTPKTNGNGGASTLLGRVISIVVQVNADGSPHDGIIEMDF